MRTFLSSVPVRPLGRKVAGRGNRRGIDRYARGSMTQGPTFQTPKWLNGGGETAEPVVRKTLTQGPSLPAPTWFIGCGNMGGAIVAGWRGAGIDLSQAVVIRPSGTPVEGVRTVAALGEAGAPPKLVVLAVKPQMLDKVAREL